MNHNELVQLVYVSKAVALFSESQHVELLLQARTFNSEHDITGMLLYKDMSYMQLLEGPNEHVKTLFSCIQRDNRHSRVEVLLDEPIQKRQFKDWSMGFTNLHTVNLSKEQGFSDFMQNKDSFSGFHVEPNLALKLLLCFRAYS